MLLQRMLSPVVDVRREESLTVVMMFAYSFLAMTAYNILKPLTRSKFISTSGADNLPYVLLAAGLIIGVVDDRLYLADGAAAATLGAAASRRPAWRSCCSGSGCCSRPAAVGLGGVLPDGAAARRAPHQPVLDARQPGLRPAPGQAAVRVHRRRRTARRHRRVGALPAPIPADRHEQHAAVSGTLMRVLRGRVRSSCARAVGRPGESCRRRRRRA